MIDQKNSGYKNQNISIRLENSKIIINSKEDTVLTLTDLWNLIISQFDERDYEIREKLPNNLLINKTQQTEEYDSSKIISSLLKIGLPLPAAIEVVEKTFIKINRWIDSQDSVFQLTTKVIRQIVSESIQELDISKWSQISIQKWNTKYVRRYGHNNRVIKIYNIPDDVHPEPTVNISYEFISKHFLPDIVHTIVPTIDMEQEISSGNRSDMVDEIMEFVNNCDLYMIDYTVLKKIIMEIATQLPHPWFVGLEDRKNRIKYDSESVRKNLVIAKEYQGKNESLPSSLIIEILHHAASMILEKYVHFLGCYDLTPFYKLLDIVSELLKSLSGDQWNMTVTDSPFKGLFEDCTIASINLIKFSKLMKNIKKSLQAGNTRTASFANNLVEFAEMSLLIQQADYNRIHTFVNSSWSNYESSQRNKMIKTILFLLFPHKEIGVDSVTKVNFWLQYQFPNDTFAMKKHVFTIIAEQGCFDFTILNTLKSRKAICNTIFFITEEYENFQTAYNGLMTALNDYDLLSDFTPVLLSKKDLKEILESRNRYSYFANLYEQQILYT